MKKTSLLILALVFSGCTQRAPESDVKIVEVPDANETGEIEFLDSNQVVSEEKVLWETYNNEFYGFSLQYPAGLKYCLNDFCTNDMANEVDDSAMLRFAIEGYENTNYADVEVRNLLNGAFIEIYPLKNSLGMSAIDFAKRSLELNRKYRPDKKYYSDEKEGEFNGITTFEFVATGGFEERGKQIEGNAAVNAPDLFEKAGEGLSLEVPHKIIYFDYNGMIYRVMYPIANKLADKIIDSFEFSGTRPE